MSDRTIEPLRWGNAHHHFLAHCLVMPLWHKCVVILAMLLAAGGGSHRLLSGHAPRHRAPARDAIVQNSPAPPPSGTAAAQPAPDAADGDLASRISPHAMRVGFSIIAGLVLGWLLRAFVKMVAMLLILGVGVLLLLSYFHVLNIDLSTTRTEYATALHWLGDQASRLKDVIVAHVPSTGGGALGAFLGFHRK